MIFPQNKSTNYYFLFLLFFICIFAHFIPFERAIISSDTFTFIGAKKNGLDNFLLRPDRPLEYIIHELEYFFLQYNFKLYFVYLLFSVFFLISSIYFFFKLFFNSQISFLITSLYLLLPYKLEIYHSSIFAWINIIDAMYIFSIIFFILFLKTGQKKYFLISFLVYGICILSRESGFFIPLIFIAYVFLILKDKSFFNNLKILSPYFILMILNLIYRFTGGFFNTSNTGREILLSNIPYGIIDFFNIFFGRYLFKHIIYGLYQFMGYSFFVILIFCFINLIIVFIFSKSLSERKLPNLKKNYLIFFIFFILISLTPNVINGSIGGRSTIIASLGISFILVYFVNFFYTNYKKLAYLFIFLLLIISQGNSLAQVISLRIPNAIFEYTVENQKQINKYKNIIIDTKSFAENINYTLLNKKGFDKLKLNYNKFNILNTYMGAQCFESWGLVAMTNYALKNKNKKIYITTESLKNNNNFVESAIYINAGYNNKFLREEIFVEENDVYIINYNKVYKNGYIVGKRF